VASKPATVPNHPVANLKNAGHAGIFDIARVQE
jgi:hypothetical protein